MRQLYYKLTADHRVVKATRDEWGRLMEDNQRRIVEQTNVGRLFVSTVFLGLDHSFSRPLQVFETMVFGDPDREPCWRYATWNEATAGHQRVVAALQAGTPLEDI